MNTDKERLIEDIEGVNLGNLNTVEFDLDLPHLGDNGSIISWESMDSRYLKRDGRVIQPRNGTGKRIVSLVGRFQYKEYVMHKEFHVTILEENKKFKVVYIHPIHVVVECRKSLTLPNTVIIETDMNEILTHTIDWKEYNEHVYEKEGLYTVHGTLLNSDVAVSAQVNVVSCINEEYLHNGNMLKDVACYVTLKDSIFYEVQMEMLTVLLAMDDDQMLYNFRTTCGLDTKDATPMSGWDTPDSNLRGHTTGHYLSALAKCYKAIHHVVIKEKITYMINELMKCQNQFSKLHNFHKGYLGGFDEHAYDNLEQFKQYPQVWAPYYTMHKIMAGLLDCYEYMQCETALEIVKEMGLWIYERLQHCSKTQRKIMWGIYIAGEYGGMNESLAKLYRYTEDTTFLIAAKMFDNDRLFFPMLENIDALCYLHVNQHIPQILGALEICKGLKEKKYYDIASNFWDIVIAHHIYTNGGIGEGEIFHQSDAIASMIDDNTAETCASYNMLKLTKELFRFKPAIYYMDYYERVMVNHILATRISGVRDGSTYFFSMEPGSKKLYHDENSCCHGTGLENHFQYMDAIFFEGEHELYINLFMSANLTNVNYSVDMNVDMQEPDKVHIKIKSQNVCTIKIRIPYWANAHEVMMNDKIIQVNLENGYIFITRKFNQDALYINFACSYFLEATIDDPTVVSLHYGPYALCALHDSREYLYTNLKQNKLAEQMKKDGLIFYDHADLLKFIPLCMIEEQRYHTYIKMLRNKEK